MIVPCVVKTVGVGYKSIRMWWPFECLLTGPRCLLVRTGYFQEKPPCLEKFSPRLEIFFPRLEKSFSTVEKKFSSEGGFFENKGAFSARHILSAEGVQHGLVHGLEGC